MNWILLRGLARESRHWGGFPAVLEGAIPGARTLAPDLPGCGALHLLRSPSSVDSMVEAYRGIVHGHGLAGPFHLLGLSLGGMVAAAWASRHPKEVGACAIVNGSMRPWCRWHERLDPRNGLALLRAALDGRTDLEREEAVLRVTSAAPGSHPALAEEWARYRRENPVSAANALRQLLAAARFRAPAPPAAPVLVLCSRGDALVSPCCSMRLAAAWNVGLAIHPTAGHDLPLDDPAWVAGRVAGWIAALRR